MTTFACSHDRKPPYLQDAEFGFLLTCRAVFAIDGDGRLTCLQPDALAHDDSIATTIDMAVSSAFVVASLAAVRQVTALEAMTRQWQPRFPGGAGGSREVVFSAL